jgi:hypothetical protein
MMSNEPRLKEILAKQAQAAEKRRDRAQQDDLKEKDAADLQAKVLSAWPGKRERLQAYVAKLNQKMAPNGVQLYIRSDRTDERAAIDTMTIAFEQFPSGGTTNHKRLTIVPTTTGRVKIAVGTSTQWPVKHYDLHVLNSPDANFEDAVLDFLDANPDG